MAVSYVSSGAVVYSTNTVSPVTPAHNVNDLLILTIGTKPDTTPATTPTGWTSLGVATGGTGTTGIDTGPMRVGVFYRIADGSALDTTGAITITGNNVSAAQVHVFRNATGAWNFAGVGAADITTGTPHSVTMPTNPGMTAGDMLFAIGVIPTDVGAGAQFSAQTVAATGMTTVTLTEIAEWSTSSGQDMGGWLARGPVVTGTATAAPTVSATASGTTTNVAGPIYLVRMSEVVAKSASDGATITVSETSSTTGKFSFSNLQDNFSTQNVSMWNFGTGSSVTNGELRLPADTTYQQVVTKDTYTMSGSSIAVQIVHAPSANIYQQAYARLSIDNNDQNACYWIAENGKYIARYTVDGVAQTDVNITPSSMDGMHVRFRDDLAGNLLWEYSSDGSSWTIARTLPFSTFKFNQQTAIFLTLMGGQWQTATGTDDAVFDNVNITIKSATDAGALSVTDASAKSVTETGPVDPVGTDSAAIFVAETASVFVPVSASDGGSISVSGSVQPLWFDDFNRTSLGTEYTATAPTSGMAVSNNQIVGGTVANAIRYRRKTSGVQVSEFTYVGGVFIGPTVAMPYYAPATALASAGTWYTFRQQGTGAGVHLAQKNAGAATHTTLASSTTNLVAGDVVRVEWDGTQLRGYINGNLLLTATPATPITGQQYVGWSHGSSTQSGVALIDNWRGGEVYRGPNVWQTIPKTIDFPFSDVNLPTGWNNDPYHQYDGDRDAGTRKHRANDLMVPYGTPVYAVAAGTIDSYMPGISEPIVPGSGGGYQLRIDTADGLRYVYAHFGPDALDSASQAFAPGIVPGATVTKGQLLGWAGQSGSAESGPHLHFAIRDMTGAVHDEPYGDYSATLGTEEAPRYDPYPSLLDAMARPAPGNTTTNITASDSAAVSIADTSAKFVTLPAFDAGAVSVGETTSGSVSATAADTASIAVTETANATLSATIPGTESTAIGLVEQATIAVTVSSGDTSAVAVSDAPATGISLSRSDASGIGVSDASNLSSTTVTGDTGAVSVTESSAVAITASAADTAAVSVSDNSTVAVSVAPSDTAALSVSESRTVAASTTRTDTATISLTDTSSLLVLVSASDSGALSVSETASSAVAQTASDSAALSVSESASNSVTLAASDTAAIAVNDTSVTFKQITASDTGAISITSAVNASIVLPGTESNAISVTDTASVGVSQPVSDTGALSVSDSSEVLVKVVASDNAAVSVSDDSEFYNALTADDTVGVSVDEAAELSPTVYLYSNDIGSIAVSDTAHQFKTVSAEDSGAIGINDQSVQHASVTTSDNATLGVVEQASSAVAVTASDATALSISETTAFDYAGHSGSDNSGLRVVETSSLSIRVQASDTAGIAVSDSGSLGGSATKSSVDSGSIAVSEVSSTKGANQAGDASGVSVAESSTVFVRLSASDGAAISVSSTVSEYRKVSSSEQIAVSLAEKAETYMELDAADSGSVSVSEVSELLAAEGFFAIESEDSSALGVNEYRKLDNGEPVDTLDVQVDSQTKTVSFASGSQGGTIEEVDTSTNTNVRMEGSVTPERRVL